MRRTGQGKSVDQTGSARKWRLKLWVAATLTTVGSGTAFAQCLPSQPDPLDLALGQVCVEGDGNRTGTVGTAITVEGTYTGTNMTIAAANGSGIEIVGPGIVNLTGGSLVTSGSGGYGIEMRGGGTGTLRATDFSVTTTGDAADAITLDGYVFVELLNVELTTNQSSASGIEAFNGAVVEGTNVTITTTQSLGGGTGDSDGIFVWNDSTVTLRDSRIDVSGPDSSGVALWERGAFYGENITITVNSDYVGANPAGVYSSDIGAIADIVGGSIATSGQQNHALLFGRRRNLRPEYGCERIRSRFGGHIPQQHRHPGPRRGRGHGR